MNKITIAVSELKSALPGFSRVINKRTTLPVLGCILFESKQGQIQLTGTNLDDYGVKTVSGRAGDLRAAIPFESINKIVKSCAQAIELTIETSKDEVRVTYPFSRTTLTERIACPAAEEFPALPDCNWQEQVTVGEDFKQAILEALDSASTDESRYILNSAFVDVSDSNAHYVVATNGRELYSANSFQIGFKDSVVVPNRKFLLWKGFMDDGDWSIALSCLDPKKTNAGWIKVMSNQWTLITKQIDGTYPNWKAPIPHPQEAKTHVSFPPEAAEFVINAAPRLPGANLQSEPIVIRTQDHSVFLAGKDHSNEAVLPVVAATAEGSSTVIGLNRQLLIKAMKLGLNTAELHTASQSMPIAVFKRDGKRLVIAGLRPDVAETITSTSQPQTSPQASSPEVPEEEAQQQENQEMKTANRIENVPTETTNTAPASASAFDQVRIQLENMKEKLRGVLTDINESLKMLTHAQKERRATEKEIEEVRETLQSLQKIRI